MAQTEEQKKYIFTYTTDTGHYQAGAFAVRCFDNRFWRSFREFMHHEGLGHIDAESVAGGAKIFASPEKEGDQDFMLRELEKSIALHRTTRVMLFTHSDCGAYGGFQRFNGNTEEELDFHKGEHQKARVCIQEHFPELTVETYFIDPQGVIRTS